MSEKQSVTILNEKPVTSFLLQYENKKTQNNYQAAIYHYLRLVSDVEKNKPDYLDSAAAEYLKEVSKGRNLISDLISAGKSFSKNYAPVSTRLMLHFITLWLESCGYTLNKRESKRIFVKLPPAYPVRKEAELTRSMFQHIFHNLSPEWTKVLLLILLGSGMRLGEALSLKTDDVLWKNNHTEISIRAETTKTKMARTVYLTKEASSALKIYLEKRKRVSDRIFPYSIAAAERAMRIAADKAGYKNQNESQRLVHWHMTRKWFISRFSLYASKEVAEHLAGHEGYLGRSYRRFTRQQVLTQVRKAETYISLFSANSETPQKSKGNTKDRKVKYCSSFTDEGWKILSSLPNSYISADTIV